MVSGTVDSATVNCFDAVAQGSVCVSFKLVTMSKLEENEFTVNIQ